MKGVNKEDIDGLNKYLNEAVKGTEFEGNRLSKSKGISVETAEEFLDILNERLPSLRKLHDIQERMHLYRRIVEMYLGESRVHMDGLDTYLTKKC